MIFLSLFYFRYDHDPGCNRDLKSLVVVEETDEVSFNLEGKG
jgi:hypothetical protein